MTVSSMASKFSTNDNAVLLVILINVLAFLSIPLIYLVFSRSSLLLILFFCFLVVINLGSRTFSKPAVKFSIFTVLGFIIVCSFIVSSFYFNLETNMNIKAISKLLLYPIIIYLCFYFFPFSLISKEEKFERFLSLCIHFAVINSIIAFIFLFIEYYPGLVFPGHTLGFFYHPNAFAFVFTIAIPIVLYKYINKQIALLPYILIMTLLSACLLFTFSRAGFIGTLTAIAILLFKKSKVLFVTALVLILILSSTFLMDFAKAKGGMSAITRVQVMLIGYDMIANNGLTKLLWGYGVMNSEKVFVEELTTKLGTTRPETGPHNFIISLSIQYGALLTIASLIFIVLLLLKAFLVKKKNIGLENYHKMNLSIAIVSGLTLQCMFEDFIIYPEFFGMPMFLIFLGYMFYSVYSDKLKVIQ